MFTQKSTSEHKHILKKAFKKTLMHGEARYFLMRVCTNSPCEYIETYDLVRERPGG